MHIAVIGAGPGGLAAARRALATDGVQVTVFEQSARLGGTWVYSERVGNDEYGLPVPRPGVSVKPSTNGPKEIMGFPDFPYDSKLQSFIQYSDVIAYLEHFAEHFNLAGVIKFRHQVLNVRPIVDSTRWSVTVRNICAATDSTAAFDAVIVCNGHYTVPAYPDELPGRDVFAGQQVHSRDYRRADAFAGKSVLVIGSGPSGSDIAWNLRHVVAKLCMSTRGKATAPMTATFGASIVRPSVARLTETGARFEDGTEERFDVIVYCTGYLFRFPFLGAECAVQTDDNHVRPLFKQCVHIEHTTMFLIGLTSFDLPCLVMDVQVRFALALLTGRWQLPTRAEMLRTAERDLERCWASGYGKREAHKLGDFLEVYIGELVEMAHLEPPPPPVLFKMFHHTVQSTVNDWARFRTVQYQVVDDDTFTHHYLNEST